MAALPYTHVDVFSARAFNGNSLPVFTDAPGLSAEQMLAITQEMRHFEAIFLVRTGRPDRWRAHVFDLFGELPFAGHPIIGAAAALHHAVGRDDPQTWCFEMPSKAVTLTTERTRTGFFGLLDQGTAEFFGIVEEREVFAHAFDLHQDDLHPDLPLEVISTGLRYLIVPVRPGSLDRACLRRDITGAVRAVGAEFAVLLDEEALEIRHWNNDGIIEDVATGSAAGTIGAYRLRHGLAEAGEPFVLKQGRHAGRPSQIRVVPEGTRNVVTTVKVGGDVALVGRGTLEVLP